MTIRCVYPGHSDIRPVLFTASFRKSGVFNFNIMLSIRVITELVDL